MRSCRAARWDAFVAGSPGATFSIARVAEIITEVFRHRTHFLYVERAGRIQVLPLAHVKSVLFGDALVCFLRRLWRCGRQSSTLRPCSRRGARALAQRLAVDHLEMRNVSARHPSGRQDLYVTFRRRSCRRRSQPARGAAQAAGNGAQA
jgi:hypothetical protein